MLHPLLKVIYLDNPTVQSTYSEKRLLLIFYLQYYPQELPNVTQHAGYAYSQKWLCNRIWSHSQ